MTKILNRNHLKIIACLTMLIDHVGFYLINNLVAFRIIGRIAFPIFAFFIAEGYYFTSNKKKYIVSLLFFAILSVAPYFLIFKSFQLNILFTYLFSIVIIHFLEQLQHKKFSDYWFYYLLLILLNLLLIILSMLNLYSYGYIGVLVPIVFYFFRNSNLKYLIFTILMLLLSLPSIISNPLIFKSYIQLFSILTLPLLFLYNGTKGKLKLKYLFYAFYPVHLIIIFIIKTII